MAESNVIHKDKNMIGDKVILEPWSGENVFKFRKEGDIRIYYRAEKMYQQAQVSLHAEEL